MNKVLVFAYNIDSSFLDKLTDWLSRLFGLSQKACSLRRVTHTPAGIKHEWQKFLQFIPYQKEFLYRDQFKLKYPDFKSVPLPAIFMVKNSELKLLVTAQEIRSLNLKSIKSLLKERVALISQGF